MAVNLTQLAVCQKRIISALLLNRLNPYTAALGTNSRYQVLQEITDAILDYDMIVCVARMDTPGDTYRPLFLVASSNLANGDFIPGHLGSHGDVDVDDGTGFKPARYASSRATILEMIQNPTQYPGMKRWAVIEDGRCFHNGNAARVWIPQFTKTAACQSPEVDELAVICGGLASLVKDGSATPEIFTLAQNFATQYVAGIRSRQENLAPDEQLEKALMAA